jgi:hypothetical protein
MVRIWVTEFEALNPMSYIKTKVSPIQLESVLLIFEYISASRIKVCTSFRPMVLVLTRAEPDRRTAQVLEF